MSVPCGARDLVTPAPAIGGDDRLLGAVIVYAIARIAPEAWSVQAPRVFS